MLPRRVLDGLGIVLAAGGLVKYFMVGYTSTRPLIVGLVLGAAVIMAGRVGGGPRPMETTGWTYPDAMSVLRRATWGGLVLASAFGALAFYHWFLGLASAMDVVLYIALGLLVAFASVVAACGLVIVDALKQEGTEAEAPPSPVSEATGLP